MFDLPKPILTQLLTAYYQRKDTLTPSEQEIARRIRVCGLCAYIWVARKNLNPKRCPHCHRHAWDRPLVTAMLLGPHPPIVAEVIPQKQITANAEPRKEEP